MPLLQLLKVDFSIGGPLLLDKVDFALEPGERIAVVGRNGAGKSTLLRLIAGEIRPDDGEVRRSDGLRIAALAQEVPQGMHGSVFDVVAGALGVIGDLLAEYHHLIHADAAALASTAHQQRMTAVHEQLDALSGWNLEQRVERTLSRYGLDAEADFDRLSGGMKRRVLLARATVGEPDLLLLDEPTNHLDLAAIEWLEGMVREFPGAVVFVTHDRRFLRQLATRIVEIDRGALTSWPGDYDNYLRRREERAHAEAEMTARFDKKLAEEEVWIRQGVKARRTRAEARVQALVKMRSERAARREQSGKVKLELAQAATSGKLVAEASGLSYAVGGRTLIRDFDATVLRGDRIGIIGPNGSGKTTLLRLLLGELQPTAGSVRVGSKLEIAYFDQYRRQLDENASTMDNVADGADTIEFNGSRRHVLGYLQDFLFSPERARAPITKLSGGERNRLLLARLFARPSNLLVMDEPTNDLDVETLELLEELLANYPGTLLLVSHDRDFLDAVVTSTFVLEGDGAVREYVGGYTDWLRQRPAAPVAAVEKQRENSASVAPSVASAVPGATASFGAAASNARRRLNNKEQRELAALPGRIEALDAEIAALQATMGTPEFFRQEGKDIAAANARLAELTTELDAAYARWQELE